MSTMSASIALFSSLPHAFMPARASVVQDSCGSTSAVQEAATATAPVAPVGLPSPAHSTAAPARTAAAAVAARACALCACFRWTND